MCLRHLKDGRRPVRWLLLATALALTPKCIGCVLVYTGLGVALGYGLPEICGAPAGSSAPWTVLLAAARQRLVF